MGRPVHPSVRQYDEAGFGAGVYLAEIGGMVKVGQSRCLAHRLRSLHRAHAARGEVLSRFCVLSNVTSARARLAAESACIAFLALVAESVHHRREYFTGITFETAAIVLSAPFDYFSAVDRGEVPLPAACAEERKAA